jgi:two-component system, OmpR family, alkaline phosphatase synthesis response regulator PhoP
LQPGGVPFDDEEHRLVTRVLVIDDEASIRLLCRVNLEADGMEVLEATDGAVGLQRAGEEQPDVVLLDLMMPRLNGWEVAEQLLADERTSEIAIVFLTGRVEVLDRARGLEIGRVAFVLKPFSPFDLAPLVHELIAQAGRDDLRAEKLARLRVLADVG